MPRFPVAVSRTISQKGWDRSKPCAAILCSLLLSGTMAAGLHAQRTAPTAIRRAMLQVGGGFSLAEPDYSQSRFRGGSAYATFDFAPHVGVEFMLHQVNSPGSDQIAERTYELGPRYVWHLHLAEPYIKVSYGRGVFNFPNSVANLAYNMATVAGGVDVSIHKHIAVRGEFEYQRWLDFPANGLTPQVATFGAAYRF